MLGEVWQTETYIHVRWGWLALSASLVLLTGIFYAHILLVSLKMREEGMGHNWKSSPWPLLFGGVEQEHETPKEEADMVRTAEKLKVKLGWADDGWKFREQL